MEDSTTSHATDRNEAVMMWIAFTFLTDLAWGGLLVRGPSLKRWRFGPTRGNKGLTLPTFSLTYEKQFWLGRTEQKRVKLDVNEQRVFCPWLPWQRDIVSRNPPFNASKGCVKWSKGTNYSWETLDFAGLQKKIGKFALRRPDFLAFLQAVAITYWNL